MESSAILFPLRSNASTLVKGAQAKAVEQRIKVAALLYDKVYIEAGTYTLQAGPGGAFATRSLTGGEWQSAANRTKRKGKEFYVALRPDSAPAETPFRRVMQSESTYAWNATFEPFRDKIGSRDWLTIGILENEGVLDRDVLRRLDWEDDHDPHIRTLLPEHHVRSKIIEHVNSDLLRGQAVGATVSIDRFHASIASARIARGAAVPMYGAGALTVLVPDVGKMPWSEIDSMRRHRDLAELRVVLGEIEKAASDPSISSEEFERRIRGEHEKRLLHTIDRIQNGGRGQKMVLSLVTAAVGLAYGHFESSGPIPPNIPFGKTIAQKAVGWAGEWIINRMTRPRWVNAYAELKKRSEAAASGRTTITSAT